MFYLSNTFKIVLFEENYPWEKALFVCYAMESLCLLISNGDYGGNICFNLKISSLYIEHIYHESGFVFAYLSWNANFLFLKQKKHFSRITLQTYQENTFLVFTINNKVISLITHMEILNCCGWFLLFLAHKLGIRNKGEVK